MAELESHPWIYLRTHGEVSVCHGHFKPNHDVFLTFMNKNHLDRVGKNIVFWFEDRSAVPNMARLQKKYTNISSGYVLTDVGAQSHIAVAGFAAFSPVTPPPSTPPADQKVSVYAHNAPVI